MFKLIFKYGNNLNELKNEFHIANFLTQNSKTFKIISQTNVGLYYEVIKDLMWVKERCEEDVFNKKVNLLLKRYP